MRKKATSGKLPSRPTVKWKHRGSQEWDFPLPLSRGSWMLALSPLCTSSTADHDFIAVGIDAHGQVSRFLRGVDWRA
jgi:hypothetical protein